jgi:hypothetical protein
MFLKNKKFLFGLIILTLIEVFVLYLQKKQSDNISKKEIAEFSIQFNKNLPIRITKDISLIKTQIGTLSANIFTLDFFYAYYLNKSDIKNFDKLTQNMIFQTCQNDTMLSLLQRNVLIRHQFITLDKEKLPYIGVSILDCQEKVKKN